MKHSESKVAFGDFQTPIDLALECCRAVKKRFASPSTVIEPTCGQGAFVIAAATLLPNANVVGFEINDQYRREARRELRQTSSGNGASVIKKQDFFAADWEAIRRNSTGPVLFLGNPPWVTNSALGVLQNGNLPAKSNAANLRGIDAITGRSNFDISESMLHSLLRVMVSDEDCLAMLVKTATARNVLRTQWKAGQTFSHASIHVIDAKQHFDVTVDACLLILAPTANVRLRRLCKTSPALDKPATQIAMGWHDGRLVVNPRAAAKTAFLVATYKTNWRSGIKHDVSRVVELHEIDGVVTRQDGSVIDVERDRLYPLAKGADVANGRTECTTRRLLVTQHAMNESTSELRQSHPKTHIYLQRHRGDFDSRKSSIYKNRDPFALFGIGSYTFAPYKVAVCGLYKRLQFTLLRPIGGQPVVVDDTCYFLSFQTEQQATLVHELLSSQVATDFFQARIFWDSKRPITADVLRRLDLRALAKHEGCESLYDQLFPDQLAHC